MPSSGQLMVHYHSNNALIEKLEEGRYYERSMTCQAVY